MIDGFLLLDVQAQNTRKLLSNKKNSDGEICIRFKSDGMIDLITEMVREPTSGPSIRWMKFFGARLSGDRNHCYHEEM